MLASLGIDLPTAILLVLALLLALSFEFVNGFHDTANAVATVIYTRALKPNQAVVWSGAWNLIGVLHSSGAVAFGIVALLPVELVIHVGSGAGFAMVFALLTSAIVWNLGTWYLGLPASSSHTLIGSIVGVGLMNSLLSPGEAFGEGVNWAKVQDTVKALVFSPIMGFVLAALLLLILRVVLASRKELFQAPEGDSKPPAWVRALLILTCTGVSFAHGSNDGQKGMGLMVLILVGIVPATYALDLSTSPAALTGISSAATQLQRQLQPLLPADGTPPSSADARTALTAFLRNSRPTPQTVPALAEANRAIVQRLSGVTDLHALSGAQRRDLRLDVYLVSESLARLSKIRQVPAGVDASAAGGYQKSLKALTNFIPVWIKVAVALALGLGTMIGWKRIVVTVGEKIGKAHLTYAQGASAEIIAWGTIETADLLGLPVSTTHILSSGIAGTMVANGSGIQRETVRNIILAWVLTLPVCVLLGAALFGAGLLIVFRVLGVH
ncbi:MAG TPA: inorganic phosphate transporter [Steroidobacteraceae bacterium]|nr:inorganic phosphate transporter [Steroidobacteraceae bacterium]